MPEGSRGCAIVPCEMSKLDFIVVVHKAEEGGYWAEVPALPGCYTQGETVEETLSSAVEAIESHLEAIQEEGMPLPPTDTVTIGRVTVDAPF